ncbi:MAG: hypothetical protein LBC04_00810 [Holosporaceae bacterium]|jgi:hypothetical protein|nr:hypothetical protein [Holosporaceae bacterium]
MLQIDIKNKRKYWNAVFFGGIGVLFVLLAAFSSVRFLLLFSGLPIMASYLAYGSVSGNITTVMLITVLFFMAPLEISCDILLNVIVPAAMLGHFSIKNVTLRRKIWWYPESLLLQRVLMLYLASVVFLSLVFYSEDVLTKNATEALNVLFKPEGASAIFVRQLLLSSVKYSVGIGSLTKMFVTLMNFGLAHFITKRMKINIRQCFDFVNVRIHYTIAILPLVALTAATVSTRISFVCSGLCVVGLFAPIVSGLAAIHRIAKGNIRILFVFYFAVLIFTLPLIVVVVLLGIINSFHEIQSK